MTDPISATGAQGTQAAQSGGDTGGALTGSKKLGKNGFLKLLVTQLKNQNPSSPMKGRKFASQLAKFSSLEQLSNINGKLETQTGASQRLSRSVNSSVATDLVGKSAEVNASKVHWNGSDPALVGMELTSPASEVQVTIKGPDGEPIRRRTLPNVGAGTKEIEWAGTNQAGKPVEPGNYSVQIEATGPEGDAVQVQPYVQGEVSRVSFGQDGTRLEVNGAEVALADVRSVAASDQ